MRPSQKPLRIWEAPTAEEIGNNVEEFLTRLGGPAWLSFPGEDRTRTRAISTLLHGNEPSGIHAVFDWVKSGERPAVNLVCFIGAVQAALAPPGFGYRNLPGWKDLNRCFCDPFDGREGEITAEVLRSLRFVEPEALLDIHNTSGMGPCYTVSTRHTAKHEVLTNLFSQHFILTDLRLGTLMEATEDDFPTITVECGGANDPGATKVATQGLFQYATTDSLFQIPQRRLDLTIHKHPIRVELCNGAQVAYASAPVPGKDLTFHADVDQYNFGVVPSGRVLGWLGPRGLGGLRALDAEGQNRSHEFFSNRDGSLEVIQSTRFFMVTTDPDIAQNDCLFYVIAAERSLGHH